MPHRLESLISRDRRLRVGILLTLLFAAGAVGLIAQEVGSKPRDLPLGTDTRGTITHAHPYFDYRLTIGPDVRALTLHLAAEGEVWAYLKFGQTALPAPDEGWTGEADVVVDAHDEVPIGFIRLHQRTEQLGPAILRVTTLPFRSLREGESLSFTVTAETFDRPIPHPLPPGGILLDSENHYSATLGHEALAAPAHLAIDVPQGAVELSVDARWEGIETVILEGTYARPWREGDVASFRGIRSEDPHTRLVINATTVPPLRPGRVFLRLRTPDLEIGSFTRVEVSAELHLQDEVPPGEPARLPFGVPVACTFASRYDDPVRQFALEVPAEARSLTVSVEGQAASDVDLYIAARDRFTDPWAEAEATATTGLAVETLYLDTGSSPPLQPGRRYVVAVVNAGRGATRAVLTAWLDQSGSSVSGYPVLTPGRDTPLEFADGDLRATFWVDVPATAAMMAVRIADATADMDLYIANGPALRAYAEADYETMSPRYDEQMVVDEFSSPPLQPGRYTIVVRNYRGTAARGVLTVGFSPLTTAVPRLIPGRDTDVTFRTGGADRQVFSLDVPPDAIGLTVAVTGSEVDLDLYLRRGAPAQGADEAFLAATGPGGEEDLRLGYGTPLEVQPGRWYVTVRNYARTPTRALVRAETFREPPPVTEAPPALTPDNPTTLVFEPNTDELAFTVDVPGGVRVMRLWVSGSSLDLDLAAAREPITEVRNASHRAFSSAHNERLSVANPAPGTWHVLVRRYDWGRTLATLSVAFPETLIPVAGRLLPGRAVVVDETFGQAHGRVAYELRIPEGTRSVSIAFEPDQPGPELPPWDVVLALGQTGEDYPAGVIVVTDAAGGERLYLDVAHRTDGRGSRTQPPTGIPTIAPGRYLVHLLGKHLSGQSGIQVQGFLEVGFDFPLPQEGAQHPGPGTLFPEVDAQLEPGVDAPATFPHRGRHYKLFDLDIPDGVGTLMLEAVGSTGSDVDLLLDTHGRLAHWTDVDRRAQSSASRELLYLSHPRPGRYRVALRNWGEQRGVTARVTASLDPDLEGYLDGVLAPGHPQVAMVDEENLLRRYRLVVPRGTGRVDLSLRGSGDVDLDLFAARAPFVNDPQGATARATSPGSDETLSLGSPETPVEPGVYTVVVANVARRAVTATLRATFHEDPGAPADPSLLFPDAVALAPDEPVDVVLGSLDAEVPARRFNFTFEVPPGVRVATLILSGARADLDLYARPGRPFSAWGHAPHRSTSVAYNEVLRIDETSDPPITAGLYFGSVRCWGTRVEARLTLRLGPVAQAPVGGPWEGLEIRPELPRDSNPSRENDD